MNYDYGCNSCERSWEENHSMNDRDTPTKKECPFCGELSVKRLLSKPSVSYDGGGVVSLERRAGSGWNDLLNKVKKQSGRNNTINTL
jgi:putative FmdB family regulatory protein